MIELTCFKTQKLALFGLGDSGIAAAKALESGGARVICWDDNERSRLKAAESGIKLNHLSEIDWSQISALVLAPGVPLHYPGPHWSVALARHHNVEIIGDIELFVRQRKQFLREQGLSNDSMPFIAITGTNGKSTTTCLITHLLEYMGCDVEMGGNIGRPILDLASFAKDRFYVIECSSFQIDLAPSINPTVGILLNITPDHIERHGNFANYSRVKKAMLCNAAIRLLPFGEDIASGTGLTYFVAIDRPIEHGYYALETKLYFGDKFIADLSGIVALRGQHNMQNALAAIAALRELLGPRVENFDWRKACLEYKGLPHRMQQIRQIGEVLFVNDSKATNAQASAPALASFENIHWIIGGIAKHGGINSLRPYFAKIRKAYLIGEAAQDFARAINYAFDFEYCYNLEQAVLSAMRDAKNTKAVVLLSPACASYDQFANYSARGDAFIDIVNNLPGERL